MNLSEKLVHLRKEKGFTQLQLAEQIHVSRQAISRWEVGDAVPSTENLISLSRLYGVSLNELTGANISAEEKDGSDTTDIKKVEKPQNTQDAVSRKNRTIWAVLIVICALFIIIMMLFLNRGQAELEDDITKIEDMEQDEVIVVPDDVLYIE